ncbi:hypothetical protein LJK88_19380 [Paenibacillus sp. P26]|nr:hypothetical protein LJK88_19380 [Paenibacillus sp. P26]
MLSFRRLAWRVMQEVGGTARLPIDETGKKLLLHKIIHKCKDRLRRFHTATDQMGFLDQINQLFSELKRYCVTADGLSRFWQERTRAQQDYFSGGLEDKLHDLQPLYAEFETELSRLYLDGEDYLTSLAQQMKESEYVSGAEVWVDGFHGFTPQELTVLEQLASHAGSVTLTLCLDRDYAGGSRPHELDLFHPTARTLLQSAGKGRWSRGGRGGRRYFTGESAGAVPPQPDARLFGISLGRKGEKAFYAPR